LNLKLEILILFAEFVIDHLIIQFTYSEFINHLQNCLDKIRLSQNTFVVLLGDFNAHFGEGSASTSSDFGAYLYRWMENSFFKYYCKYKKHGRNTEFKEISLHRAYELLKRVITQMLMKNGKIPILGSRNGGG
jgi:hypothetical protein